MATTNAPSKYTTPNVSIGARVLSTTTKSVSAEIAAAATNNPAHIGGAVGRTSNDNTRPVTCPGELARLPGRCAGAVGRLRRRQVPLAVIVNGRQRRRRTRQHPRSWHDMDTTTDSRLVRHVVVTVILATAAAVVAWEVLLTGPGMGVNRYMPGRVFSTGVGGPAMQT